MFRGRFEHSIDAKGRLAIPTKFRAELAAGLVVTRGIERCLTIYSASQWEPLAEKVSSLPYSDENARNFRRLVLAEAADCELDKQGRVLIPQYLREFACIEGEVIVAGLTNYIEVWSVENWQSIQKTLENEGAAIAQHLGNLI